MCGLFISHKFKVHISGCVPYITKCSSWSLGSYTDYLIVLRAHLRQLLTNLPQKLVLSQCIRSFIVDIMPEQKHIDTCFMGKAEE